MVRKTVRHYRVLEKLGGGGMGVVYRARDDHLDREVALKFLPAHLSSEEEAKRRFVLEAKAASALDHPNICTIHDIDESEDGDLFIAMAYYEGVTLKKKLAAGALPEPEVVRIAGQVAEGLAAAHDEGIVHRDVKPANIFITTNGRAVLLDFGLAKLVGSLDLTVPGSMLGTAAYMSPEQARGESVDHRTDIWSLGVVLYEMLCGRRPFGGAYEQAVIYAILNEQAHPLAETGTVVDERFSSILARMLAKNPNARYPSLREVISDLSAFTGTEAKSMDLQGAARGTAEGAAHIRPSIAVLPFRDMSMEKDQEYFCDGITEELINALSHIEQWRVVSRTSAFTFKNRDADVREVGRELSASHVLDGSVRKVGPHVRITSMLSDAHDGFQLWSEMYDGQIDDVFHIQDEISRAVLDRLEWSFGGHGEGRAPPGGRLVRPSTREMDAYRLYLEARFHINKRSDEDLKAAVALLAKAVELDPAFAAAHAATADALLLLALQAAYDPCDVMPMARVEVLKALELDDGLAEAHASLGTIKAAFEWDQETAEKSFHRAIHRNPNYAPAHQWYALWCLAPRRRFDESISHYREALDLDPLSPVVGAGLGWMHYFAGSYEEAESRLRATLDRSPEFVMAHDLLGQTLARRGELDGAIDELERSAELSGSRSLSLAILAHLCGVAGRGERREAALGELEARTSYVSPYYLALAHFGAGDEDATLGYLRQAFEHRSPWLLLLDVEPMWDRLRTNPGFRELVRSVGLQSHQVSGQA